MIILAAAALHMYASTPGRAAIQTMYHQAGKTIVIRRVNVAGDYATVLTAGGMMEGAAITEPILVQRFSFGWQPLEILTNRCFFDAHRFRKPVAARLLNGMPPPPTDSRCFGARRDSGPLSDVEAIRKLMSGPLVPYVNVSRDWAVGQWYGAGGGQELFHRRAGTWYAVAGGGGEMDFSIARAHGVPNEDGCALHLRGANCR